MHTDVRMRIVPMVPTVPRMPQSHDPTTGMMVHRPENMLSETNEGACEAADALLLERVTSYN